MINPELRKHVKTSETVDAINPEEKVQQSTEQPQDNRARREHPTTRLLSQYIAAPVSSATGNKRALDCLEAFRSLLDTKKKMNGVMTNLQLIAPNVPGAKFPTVACYHIEYEGADNLISLITYGVMMIETDVPLKPEESAGGQFALELPSTVDSYYNANDNYNKFIQEQIKRDAGLSENADVTMLSGGVGVLPKEVDVNDTTILDNVLGALTSQAVSPIVTSSIQNVGSHDLSTDVTVDIIREGNYRLESDITFNPAVTDVTGLPIAADALITTTAYGGGGYSVDDVSVLHNVAIKLDLTYEEREDIVASGRGHGEKSKMYHYLATHIITGVQQDGMLTLDRLLMAISTSIISQDSRVWVEMLRPRPNSSTSSIGDFSAAGWDLPEGFDEDDVPFFSPIPVQSEEYTRDNYALLYDTISENVYPDQAAAIDIPEALLGSRAIKELEKTGLVSAGSARTREEQEMLEARNDMIDAACHRVVRTLDQMTDNRFSEYFGNNLNILEVDSIMVPMGYWVDDNNNKRDLREIDYLAARNFSGNTGDEKFMRDWEATMTPQQGLETTQCAERIELMRKIVGELHIKGYAHRYIINPEFLQAAAASTVDAGVSPSFNNLTRGAVQRLSRGGPSALSNHLVSRSNVDAFARSSIRTRGEGSRSTRPTFGRRNRGFTNGR